MVQAKIGVEGTKPFWWHHFTEDAIPLEAQERTGVAGNDPEEWKKTYLADSEGHLYVEPSYVFGCIVNGGRTLKKGIWSKIASTLQIVEDKIYFDRFIDIDNLDDIPKGPDDEGEIYIDIRSVVNPSTRGRNIRYRLACKRGYLSEFNIFWDPTVVSRNLMHTAIIDGGRLYGWGDGRKIGMGRFDVLSFEIIDME